MDSMDITENLDYHLLGIDDLYLITPIIHITPITHTMCLKSNRIFWDYTHLPP